MKYITQFKILLSRFSVTVRSSVLWTSLYESSIYSNTNSIQIYVMFCYFSLLRKRFDHTIHRKLNSRNETYPISWLGVTSTLQNINMNRCNHRQLVCYILRRTSAKCLLIYYTFVGLLPRERHAILQEIETLLIWNR